MRLRTYLTVGLTSIAVGLAGTACKGVTTTPVETFDPETVSVVPTPIVCGPTVTVTGNEQVPCDLDGSQQLNVRDVTQQECDDMGGRYEDDVCQDVDY